MKPFSASVRLPDYLALSDRQIEYLALCERLQNEGIEDSGLKPTSPSNKPNSYSHLLLLTNGFNLACRWNACTDFRAFGSFLKRGTVQMIYSTCASKADTMRQCSC